MDYTQPVDRIASDEEAYYVASKTRRKFHRPACEYAAYIPAYKRLIFDSHREAREAGFKPCGTCRA
jgi:methylphosphotriester-DNA--protein-cysteine methyltransferase